VAAVGDRSVRTALFGALLGPGVVSPRGPSGALWVRPLRSPRPRPVRSLLSRQPPFARDSAHAGYLVASARRARPSTKSPASFIRFSTALFFCSVSSFFHTCLLHVAVTLFSFLELVGLDSAW